MHTVRNRVASKPRQKGKAAPPGVGHVGKEPAFLLRNGNPPAFPAGLIVPAPRGAIISLMPWPEVAASGAQTRLAPKASTRRKPAKRKTVATRKSPARTPRAPKQAKRPAVRSRKSPSPKPAIALTALAVPELTPVMLADDLLGRALALKPEPVAATPLAPAVPPVMDPVGAGAPLIPRSRAMSVKGGSTLREVIAHWLGEAGRLLARLRRPGKSGERARVARANARHRALQSQFEALEALREVAKAD